MLESYKCASDLCSAMTLDREAFSSFFEVGKLCGFQTIHTSETFFLSHTEAMVEFSPYLSAESAELSALTAAVP